jgi:hypothetical protein
MNILKNILIFLAGAMAMHTVSHLVLPYYMEMPVVSKMVTVTTAVNWFIVIISGLITAALIYAAYRISKRESSSK